MASADAAMHAGVDQAILLAACNFVFAGRVSRQSWSRNAVPSRPMASRVVDRNRWRLAAAALVVALTAFSADVTRAGADAQLARGRYLAHDVAMCVQCHTPRDARGDLDRTRLFAGAPIPVGSPFPHRPWAFQAPALAGLPGWTDADAITLLTTGRRPSGVSPNPPMPSFRLDRDDAAAVVAYLRSLGAAR